MKNIKHKQIKRTKKMKITRKRNKINKINKILKGGSNILPFLLKPNYATTKKSIPSNPSNLEINNSNPNPNFNVSRKNPHKPANQLLIEQQEMSKAYEKKKERDL